MWHSIISGWNILRMIRLALGIIITVQGIQYHQYGVAFMGALFTLMPLFNVGCCASGSCAAPGRENNSVGQPKEEIEYEEITAK